MVLDSRSLVCTSNVRKKMRTRMTVNTIRYSIFNATLVVGLVLLSGTVGFTAGQHRAGRGSANQLAQQSNSDAAATLFRSGRDLITDQEWAKAQAKFDQLVSAFIGRRTHRTSSHRSISAVRQSNDYWRSIRTQPGRKTRKSCSHRLWGRLRKLTSLTQPSPAQRPFAP